jgi:hypothetical protein
MSKFPSRPEAGQASAGQPAPAEDDLSTLFNYPSLGRLFETPNSPALAEMRARIERTHQDLERVVRQGSKEDAERAARAARAYSVTLTLLKELEELQRRPQK